MAPIRARGQLRTFALTRIANVKNLQIPFARPADFSVAKMLAGSFAAFQAARTEHVRIRFDAFAARLVRERQWHKSQKMRPADGGGMELTMRVGIAPDLENWILSWGDHAEVIEPLELRRRICHDHSKHGGEIPTYRFVIVVGTSNSDS